tara:strand:+ start:2690 stop:3004 length:315 start_codon:yes stop_codon:yes gene_type:complete
MEEAKVRIPPTKFMKNDSVRNLNGIEGIVTEVFISYPTLCGLADWSKPQTHYRVSLYGLNMTYLYEDGDLTDPRQGEFDFQNGSTITDLGSAARYEDYHYWDTL